MHVRHGMKPRRKQQAARYQNGGKWCQRCGEWYPLEDYHRNRTCPDGRRYVCKWCRYREYQARKHAGFLGPRRLVTGTDGVTT